MFVEKTRPGAYIVSEGPGSISRDLVTIQFGQNLIVGTVLGKVTATSKFKAYDSGANDGSQVAKGILFADCDASAGDTEAVATSRMATVSESMLIGLDAVAKTQLELVRITFRS